MKNKYLIQWLSLACFALLSLNTQAQCPGGEILVTVEIVPDNYPDEIAWNLAYAGGDNILSGTSQGVTACVLSGTCLIFTISDTYGDGICCTGGNGSYTLYFDGQEVATGGDYGYGESLSFNCPPGSICGAAIEAEAGGSYNASDNTWFSFSPEENGLYSISSCDLGSFCEPALWVYDLCDGLEWNDTANSTIYHTTEGCDALGFHVEAELEGGTTYYIRVGELQDECDATQDWTINYEGEITGCTDPNACSFNPLASVNDESLCFYLPDEECVQYLPSVTIGNTILKENEIATGLDVPWEILWGPDDYIWMTEKVGRISRLDPETGNITIVLELDNVSSGSERGMLGMALHPDFDNSPLVYVVYTYNSGGLKERLSSFEWDGDELDNETVLLDNIPAANIHDGSRLLITEDEKILMTTGDAANDVSSQNMNSLSGKLLRINLDGSIPDDNPFEDSYIYTYGHRNAQGLTFGPNGDIYSSEHGQNSSDEFNIIEEGRNYGWPNVQGACNTGAENAFCDQNNVKEPLIEWTPCPAVNGIEYYTHPAIPEFQDKMLMAVLGGLSGGLERISVLEFNEDGSEIIGEEEYFDNYGRLRDLCVNPHNGAVYFATNGPSYPSSGPNSIIEYRNYDWNPNDTSGQDTTGVNIQALKLKQSLNIFPNPMGSSGYFSFSDSFIGGQFQIFSYEGKLIMDRKIQDNLTRINTNHLPSGAYYIKAFSSEGKISKSFIIE